MSETRCIKKRKSYTADFKIKVIEKAEEVGNREAGRQFQVDEKCVRQWRRAKESFSKIDRRKRANRYRNPYWPVLEENLFKWIKNERDEGRPVSTIKIRLKAKIMAKEMNISNFTGNSNWCYRFMKRKKLSVRSKTTKGQQLPQDWEEKFETFKDYFSDLRSKQKYELRQIINMDEVPLAFDCPPNKTVDVTNTASVSITTTGHENTNMTVVLSCCADGSKLKPMIIFKRKTMPKQNFPPEVVVTVNEKGWMNQHVMKEWFEKVWVTRKDSFFDRKGILIMDSMKAHVDENVKKMAEKMGAKLAIIPGGLTKKLQPLDISVNRSFKSKVREEWEKWMSSGLKDFTKGGNLKRASFSEVSEWIKKAWDAVTEQTVKSGFRKPGLIDYNENFSESDSDISSSEDDCQREVPEEILKLFISDTDESDFNGFT